ncbi:AAA family ATPase [Psychrobacter sp.]|uniref:AAA family ATPase n=1 Tax=Psychrobacter sp. TaxID=56811 RepID=UPI0025DBA472|nr:AAA family ATPase [Psychrobacter sp.]
MRLKSLKLAGFKSFANPTTFIFRHGITAIVGPNGCGKSNVIDAIRWVLGESSAKQLRGGAMSDVIFAGTQNKASKSVASVELTFEHTQHEQTGIRHELNLYHELSVRRQINLEGKSDYFINGTRCRRRDVVDVFLGTGLGPRSYSVIQQGMIGRIVDSSPQQLREFIEEAAGVSRYQARREETQKKLLITQENLERLKDIEAELSRQKKKLLKQAESANQYQQIQQQLTTVKEQLAIYQLCQAKASQMQHKSSEEALTKSVSALQLQHSQIKAKFNKSSERLAQEQWLKDEARDKLHVQDMQCQQAEHQLSTLQANINQLEGRYQVNLERQKTTENRLAEIEKEQTEHAEVIRLVSPKIIELEQKLQQKHQANAPLQKALAEANNQVVSLDNQKRQHEQQLALAKQTESRLQQDYSKWQSQNNTWQKEAVKWGLTTEPDNKDTANHEDNFAKDLAQLESKLGSIVKQQETVSENLETEQPALYELSQTVSTQQVQLAQLEKQHASLVAEYETLHSIVHPKKMKSTNNVLATHHPTDTAHSSEIGSASNKSLAALNNLPVLNQQIKLTKMGEQHASVLDRWLAFWLDSRIVDISLSKDKKDADKWQQLLSYLMQTEADLSVSATAHKTLNQVKNSNKKTATTQDTQSFDNQANSVLFANSSMDINNHKIAEQLTSLADLIATPKLGLWQQCYLYTPVNSESILEDERLVTVSALIGQLPQSAFILTASGWVIGHFGAIHLSKLSNNAHTSEFLSVRLQQQQRLAILEDKLNDIEQHIETASKSLKANTQKKEQSAVFVEELTAQLSTLTHSLHNLKQQQVTLLAKQDRQNSEHQRLKQQREQLENDYQQLQKQEFDVKACIDQASDNLQTVVPKLIAAQDTQQKLEYQRQTMSYQEREEADILRQLQIELNKSELAEKHSRQQLQQLSIELKQLQQAQLRIQQEQQNLESQLPKQEASLKQASSSYHELQTALKERNAIIHTLQSEAATMQKQQNEIELQLQQQQQNLSETITLLAIANERINEAGERLKQVSNELTPERVLTDYLTHGRSLSESKYIKLQTDEVELSVKLNDMGPVNLAAAAELAAVDERLLPLEQQIDDITASMATLTDAIASIDTKTKTLFLDTLDSVNKSLTNLFTKVFGGGQASLALVKEEGFTQSEQWRAGLELMAQPKGKKNSRLAVLSGGEKTLTALSLIFAIFKQHPAPFCVLDEVDAPLDDANVMRFTNLISDLADEVQFIFISHNKLAMQIADELKGVTMPQPGISSLVSVSLEEAEHYLEPTI